MRNPISPVLARSDRTSCAEQRNQAAACLASIVAPIASWKSQKHLMLASVVFFVLLLVGLGIAAVLDAPLSFDGAFYFFTVLDGRRFAAFHGRLVNVPLQLPMLAAMSFIQDPRVLRLIFCAAYASVPAIVLGLSWLLCRSRRFLFIWPAMAICVATLPGQFSFHSEATMAATLAWPPLLVLLVDAGAVAFAAAVASLIGSAISHPCAVIPLSLLVPVAIISAVRRPHSRRLSIGIALLAGIMLLGRATMHLDPYERQTLGFHTVAYAWKYSLWGWPIVAITLVGLAALVCLRSERWSTPSHLIVPLLFAGAALAIWAYSPSDWWRCIEFRFWVSPLAVLFMCAAAFEGLWARLPPQQHEFTRLSALPVISGIFLTVIVIQSVQWERMTQRISNQLAASDSGCVPEAALFWFRKTALDHWSVTIYMADLQALKPKTLMLPDVASCKTFARTGDVTFVKSGFSVIKRSGNGQFDYDTARARMYKAAELPSGW